MTDTHAVDCGIWNHHLRSAESAPNGCNCGASPSDTPSRVSPSAPAQIVHNHGTEDGPGIRCPERMVDGKLRGECLDSPRPPSSPVPSSEPEDFEKLLAEFEVAVANNQNAPSTAQRRSGEDIRAITTEQLRAAISAIRGYVSRLQSENERLQREIRAASKMFGEVCEPLHDCCQKYKLGLGGEHVQRLVVEEVDRLHSELSRIQQTGLTAEEAAQLIWKWEGCPNRWDALVYKSAIEKLRDLAALRSLSTGDPRR